MLFYCLCSQVDCLHSREGAASRTPALFMPGAITYNVHVSRSCRGEMFNVVVWLLVALRPYLICSHPGGKLVFPQSHWAKFLSFTQIGSSQDTPLSLSQSWWQETWDNTDWLRPFRTHPWNWRWGLNDWKPLLDGREMLKWQLQCLRGQHVGSGYRKMSRHCPSS